MSVDIARMAAHLPPEEQQRVIRAYRQEAESETTAYLLCFFLGIFGAHRWYLGHWRSGLLHLIIPALVVLVVVAAVIELIPAIVAAIIVAILLAIALGWEIIDLFAIDDEVRAHNRELAERLVAGGALEDHTAFDQAVAKLDTLDRTQAAAAGGITAADVAGARALADEQGRVTSFDYYSAGDTQISAIPTQQQQQQQTAEQPGSNDWSFTETLPPEQPQTPAAPPAEDTTAPLGQMAAAAAGAGLAEDVLSFQHHETDYGTTESLEVDHVALPAEPEPGENDDTWPEMRIPPEAATAASVAAFSQSGTDWTDAGASGDNLPVADVASWPDAVRVHLPEDAPNPSDPAATFTAAPVPEFAAAESDYTDAHPHVHHNMPIADIEPGVAKPLYVTLPDQDEDTTVVLVPDLSDTQPEQPDTNTDAYSWGIAGAAAPAGSSPSWEDTQPIPPEAYVPPTVPVTTTQPEPEQEQETLGELAPLAGAGAAAMLAGGGEPDTSEAAAPPEWPVAPAPEWPTEPAPAAEPAAPAAPAEAASEAAAAAPPQRMKRVRVVRRLVVDGEVVQEQVVEEIVPADTDTAATAEQLRESLGHATPEEIAQMAHLDPNTPLELRQKTELPDSGGTQQ